MRTAALTLLAALSVTGCEDPIFCDGGSCDAGPGRDAATSMDGGADAGAMDAGLDAGIDAGGSCLDTEVQEAEDFADCLTDGCPRNDTTVGRFDLSDSEMQVRLGRIDDATHTLVGEGCGGGSEAQDHEVIAIDAPARAIVEVELAPQCPAEGAFSPWLAFDDSLRLVHIGGADVGETARVTFVHPYVDMPAYLRVEDVTNLLPECESPVGGRGHGYRLTARVTDRGPVELGALSGTPSTSSGSLARNGDLELYRFTGEAGTRAEIRVEWADGCPDALYDDARDLRRCVLHLVRLDPFGGNAVAESCDFDEETVWGSPRNDADAAVETRTVELGDEGEALFVVTDYNGAGAEGYDYTVTVTEAPSAVPDGCTF